jgi:hypothetical protein
MISEENEVDFVLAVNNIRILKEAVDNVVDSAFVDQYNQNVFTLLQQAFEAAWRNEAEYMISKYPGMDKSSICEFAHKVNNSKHSPVLFDEQPRSSEQ